MFMRRNFLKVIAWAMTLAPAIAIASADEASDDLKKLKGKWTSNTQGAEATWSFDGDKLSIEAPGRSYKIVVSIDPAAKPHKAMEMKVADDSANAKNFKGPAIYKFDGDDKIAICFGTTERPTEFKTKEDFSAFVFELARKK
jgi:uncharacterized protein (TIGR03067 family)